MDTGTAILIVGSLIVVLLVVALVSMFAKLRGVEARRAESSDALAKVEADSIKLRAAAQTDADEARAQARREVDELKAKALAEIEEMRAKATSDAEQARKRSDQLGADLRDQRADLERREQRVVEREERVDADARSLEEREQELEVQFAALEARKVELDNLEAERREILERAAQLTADQAKAELIASVEEQAKREATLLVRDIEREAQENGQARAREIITLAIQRLASEQTAESVVSVLHLPGDEMKGRIIGREGRNIRAFEQVTGVNLIIDDTPDAVLLSCFDPVRREVARLTLEELVLDGRIHPHRI